MSAEESNNSAVCRDRLGYFYKEDFKTSSCSMCYFYLILDHPKYVLHAAFIFQASPHRDSFYLVLNNSKHENRQIIYPSPDNQTSLDLVCLTLSDAECTRWTACCNDAWDCCVKQTKRSPPLSDITHCPQTFDGWSCWDYTPANSTVYQTCPSFFQSLTTCQSKKVCDSNGTWSMDQTKALEYTDYDGCSKTEEGQIYKTAIVLGIVLNATGISLVAPAILIFLYYRSLRKQQRIKIHLNLFVSLLLVGILCLVWDVYVRLDRLNNTEEESVLHTQQALCKALNVLHRCARASVFFWMSCEGYFLHRLMVNAFLPPKHFYGYLIFGWGIPILLFGLYGGIRKAVADDNVCWILPLVGNTAALEWVLVYAPTIICILANTLFLCNILKLFLTKMVNHPNEPSNFRKALKATLILVPLFGIHQFCLIYRPQSEEETGYNVYEIASTIILNSQGIIISLVFCYFNGEVQSHIKNSYTYVHRRYSNRRQSDDRKLSISTGNMSSRTSVSSLQNGSGMQIPNNTTERGSTYENGVINEGFRRASIDNMEQVTRL